MPCDPDHASRILAAKKWVRLSTHAGFALRAPVGAVTVWRESSGKGPTGMEPVAGFFASNITAVYFFYGLAFFALGLAVIVESGRAAPTPFARVMALLGPFGVVHGAGEWAEMFGLIAEQTGQPATWHDALGVLLAASSFLILMVFAVRLAAVSGQRQPWHDREAWRPRTEEYHGDAV